MVAMFCPPPFMSALSPVECEYLGNPTSTTTATTFTFSGVSFGAPAAGRVIIVMACGRDSSSRSFVSATIGGVPATLIHSLANSGSMVMCFAAIVPAGVSGEVSFTMSGPMLRAALAIYRATGVKSLSPLGVSGSTTSGGSLAVPASKGGVALGIAYAVTLASGWSGLTQRVQNSWTTNASMSSAMDLTGEDASSLPVSATMSGVPIAAISVSLR